MAATTMPAATAQITYEDLYARWERGNWSATEIDFAQDRVDWNERMSAEQREAALWLFTLFFHGEDSVTDNLSPYIDAAPLEEQKYFLATQQVDEARHAVFFKRFVDEVVGQGGDGTVGGALAATEKLLSWGHRKTFAHLDEVAAGLRKDRSPRNFASAITMYHLIVEGALAQPTQHKIDEALTTLDVLPGFREGMRNVSLDEQRHIAFGVRVLADLHERDPDTTRDAIVGKIREVLPWTTAVALPPDRNLAYTECLGIDLVDLFEEGAMLMEQRIKAIGLQPEKLERFPLPLDLPARERGERGLKLLEAGMLGPKDGPASRDPEAMAILMDTLRRGAVAGAAPSGTTIQWDFSDAEPWFLRLDNGSTAVQQGRAPHPDVTLKMTFDDFIDVAAGREDARRLILRRRIRPSGKLRALARLPKVLPG
ncbi:MAG: Sterol-binding domain protein [Solirubrobacterales bacterium]|nr:Sterol-binding domain protein [Solirubrobacterales bacterium]